MKIFEVLGLCQTYGNNTTLGDLARKIQGNKIYKCPKCNGAGKIETFDTAKDHSMDMGFIPPKGWKRPTKIVECDLCDGEGYTAHEYKPKMQQIGWE